MKINSITLAIAAMVVALGGCNRVDSDRTTSVPRGVDRAAIADQAPSGLSAPAAPAERGPIPADANAAAPGTNATLAMANQPPTASAQSEPGVAAQDAADKAPDTASGDEAKKQVMASMMASNTSSTAPTARDTELNSPRHGTLTPQQNSTELPKAGQVNNHSSTALEKDSGR